MNYEQKYRKLVDAIKEMRDVNPSDEGLQNWINDNVPELAESEDERMRKALITYFYGFPYKCLEESGTNPKEAIAWLEKQGTKEVDPRYENLKELIDADNIYQMSMNEAMVEEAKSKATNALSELAISKILNLKKEDEQKSDLREEDEEDEKIRRALIRFHKSTIDIDGVKGSEIVSWLEKQASKTKWSEEDDYNVQCCIAKAERDIANGCHGRNKELIKWLNSIKYRVK